MTKSTCPDCHGSGEQCEGGKSAHPSNWYKCPTCKGTGKIIPKSTCPLCDDGVPLVEIRGEMLHELSYPPDLVACHAPPKPDTIPLVYIMSPYTHDDPEVMEQRFDLVEHYEALLTYKFPDALFYSPISHFHQTALAFGLPRDVVYWRKKNACMIIRCQLGIVLRIEGWMESEGMEWERDLFAEFGIPYTIDDIDLSGEHEVVGQALQKLA